MESLSSALHTLDLPKKARENLQRFFICCVVWPKVSFDDDLRQCFPVGLDDDQLIVSADELYLLQKLQLHSHLLCQRLNKHLVELKLPPIKGLRTRLVSTNRNKTKSRSYKPVSINTKAIGRQTIKKVCEAIQDAELRCLFERLLTRYYSMVKSRPFKEND